MKVLILAAGKGQRFRDEGFTVSKPLIYYKGWPLIAHAIAQTGCAPSDIIIVGTPDVCAYIKAMYHDDVKVVEVDSIQRGPGMSAILAAGRIMDDEKIFVVDCDVLFDNNRLSNFITTRRAKLDGKDPDASILTTVIEGETENYCSINAVDDKVTSVEEKIVNGSGRIAVGCYYFKKFGEFRKSVFDVFLNIPEKEVYISSVLRDYLQEGLNVGYGEMEEKDWIPVGTPEDLREASDEDE